MLDKGIELFKFLVKENLVSKFLVNVIIIIVVGFLSLFVWAKYLKSMLIKEKPAVYAGIEQEVVRRIEVRDIKLFLKDCNNDGLYFIILIAEHVIDQNKKESYKFFLQNLIVKDILTGTMMTENPVCSVLSHQYREIPWEDNHDMSLDEIIYSDDDKLIHYLANLTLGTFYVKNQIELKEHLSALTGMFYRIIVAKSKINDIESDRYVFIITSRNGLKYFYIVGIPKNYDFTQGGCDNTYFESRIRTIINLWNKNN